MNRIQFLLFCTLFFTESLAAPRPLNPSELAAAELAWASGVIEPTAIPRNATEHNQGWFKALFEVNTNSNIYNGKNRKSRPPVVLSDMMTSTSDVVTSTTSTPSTTSTSTSTKSSSQPSASASSGSRLAPLPASVSALYKIGQQKTCNYTIDTKTSGYTANGNGGNNPHYVSNPFFLNCRIGVYSLDNSVEIKPIIQV